MPNKFTLDDLFKGIEPKLEEAPGQEEKLKQQLEEIKRLNDKMKNI